MHHARSDAARSFLILLNAGAGRDDAAQTQATFERVLAAGGAAHEVLRIEDPSTLTRTARAAVERARATGAVVVAAGGDGTINAVAQHVLGSGCTFGILPQGTFNYFGRTHGIPQDAEEAARVLLTGTPQPVQVGLVNDKVFLVNASLGLYPELLEDREAFKRRFGRSRLVALGAALATLTGRHPQLRLVIESQGEARRLRTPTLFIGNNALQMSQIGLPVADDIDAGCLAAVVLRPVGRWEMLWLMLSGALGRLAEADSVQSFAFRRLVVRPVLRPARRRWKVATDGETALMLPPLTFRTAPQPLMMIKPVAPT